MTIYIQCTFTITASLIQEDSGRLFQYHRQGKLDSALWIHQLERSDIL